MNTIEIKNDYPNVICFHHNDNDGILAAYVIKHKYDNNLKNNKWEQNVKCFPCAYRR